MFERLQAISALPRKALAQFRLIRSDPERVARNLLPFTNPALAETRLIDVLHAVPMHVSLASGQPTRLNILDTSWRPDGMTGGPNTVVNLAARLARHGIAVRFVSTVDPTPIDQPWLQTHAAALLGTASLPPLESATAGRPDHPLPIGPNDVFLATHWTTAQQLKPILPRMGQPTFFYMLQEFEPAFYAWSSNFALCLETLAMDFWPIINQSTLAEFLFAQSIGQLAHPQTRDRATIFDPAVDTSLFHPPLAPRSGTKRLLFYARPTNTRNMFGLGLTALRNAVADPAFVGWQFLSIGSRGSVPPLNLGHGHNLKPAPWADYHGYAESLRHADVLLCPMLSPHTSYPVLEMVASGGVSVTNTFATKTAVYLASLSPAILAGSATVEAFTQNLIAAARQARGPGSAIATPASWDQALDPAAIRIASQFQRLSSP